MPLWFCPNRTVPTKAPAAFVCGTAICSTAISNGAVKLVTGKADCDSVCAFKMCIRDRRKAVVKHYLENACISCAERKKLLYLAAVYLTLKMCIRDRS